MRWLLLIAVLIWAQCATGQVKDAVPKDDSLRITNLGPYFTYAADSVYVYQFTINKKQRDYYWYFKQAPVGLTIGKDNGVVSFKAPKNYFLSGKLHYDHPYEVSMGVQSLHNPKDKVDTTFTILFYNTEITSSRVKPSVSGTVTIEEGEALTFRLQCENGSFPIEKILFSSNMPISDFTSPQSCGEEFRWTPPYAFVKDSDSAGVRKIALSFVGTTRYHNRDTIVVSVVVKNALNYPAERANYRQTVNNLEKYVLELKYAFHQLDRQLRKVKHTRLGFDLTSASTAVTGTVLNSSADEGSRRTGQVLPSIGLALTPIKEAAAPQKNVEQNQAAQIRSSIKRLEYMLQENQLVGEKDKEILEKTQRLKDELKQVQVQMIEVPIDIHHNLSKEELNAYFNSPKVNKKYRLKKN